eukprot:scaffold20141_cov78-Skeletonema_dohrnii-CCMP3373.AAC.1
MMIPRTPLHEEPLQDGNSSNDDFNDRNNNNIVCDGKESTPADEQQQLRQMNMKRTRSRLGARSSHSLYTSSSSSSLLFIVAFLLLFSTSNCSQAASLSSIHDKTNLQDSNKNDIAAPPDSINSAMSLMASSASSPPSPTSHKLTAQQIFEANSICTQMTQSPHLMNMHLRNQPLLSSGCRKYISCDTTTATNKGS